MKIGDLVRHKRQHWFGHIMSLQRTESRLCPGIYDKVYIVEVAKGDGTRNRWPSVDLEVINDSR